MRMSGTFLIRCGACTATNRVPREKVQMGLEAICGRCGRPLIVD